MRILDSTHPQKFLRVMLGPSNSQAHECMSNGYAGVDFGVHNDFTETFVENWRDFNAVYIPKYLDLFPTKNRIAAGLASGQLWVFSYYPKTGDAIISPIGDGNFRVGVFAGDYYFVPGQPLPHRRIINWLDVVISPSEVSDELARALRARVAVSDLSNFDSELQSLIYKGRPQPVPGTAEQPSFAMERYLEQFLIDNWSLTEIGKNYDIYQEDGISVGQQYPSDTGPMDILAVSKDNKTLLVVELKRGKASDAVVGQTLRYMGYIRESIAEPFQDVRGAIIALDDDTRLQRALSMVSSIAFYRYQIDFRLVESKTSSQTNTSRP